MSTAADGSEKKKFRYGAYDIMRKKNRITALQSFGIDPEELEKIDQEMRDVRWEAGKKWSIFGCFDATQTDEK